MNIPFTCNAGMERVFFCRDADGNPVDLSLDNRFAVFFEIANVLTANEERYLVVVRRSDNNVEKKIRLKDDIGVKPLHGLVLPYLPTHRPFIKFVDRCDPVNERVLYAETDLSADSDYAVTFCLVRKTTASDDIERYLRFTPRQGVQIQGGIGRLDLDDDAGKKPLGSGRVLGALVRMGEQ